MKKSLFIAIIALGAGFSSCQKDENILPNQSEMTNLTTPPSDLDGDTTINQTKAGILSATSANQIPSQFFKVATKYKNAYVHLHQPDKTSCSWTSYVLCTGAIANANYHPYPVSNNQIYLVKNRCNNVGSISALYNYAGNYDNGIINRDLKWSNKTSSGRFQMIKYMLNHINTYHTPFVALAFDPASGKGHFLVVWSIDWKVGGTGSTIYYTNPLTYPSGSFDGVLSQTSFTTFLDWMYQNPQANKYNALFLWSK